jgi:mono/diheme cytochrome c family protein
VVEVLMRRFALFAVIVAVAVAAAACGPTPTSGNPQPTAAAGPKSPGQTVYDTQGCARCHSIAGVGGKGPDLSKTGAKHDKVWLAAHIRDAKQHSPRSKMDPYPEDKLSATDLDTLVEYLAGLK